MFIGDQDVLFEYIKRREICPKGIIYLFFDEIDRMSIGPIYITEFVTIFATLATLLVTQDCPLFYFIMLAMYKIFLSKSYPFLPLVSSSSLFFRYI